MQDFKNLDVWKKAHRLTLDAYRITESFPRAEMFGLSSQIRRAASSIQRIWPKVVVGHRQSSHDLFKSP